ncbi:DUF642 domain-containing protein [Corallococcus llansteffanensis]|uniref:DUF642 domain-containing protein n=2 Tax=Corallococcus llansteffanensis TaxID=2316731 RepID=A0A3A8NWK0_9BACT|nr:DUF642 domain-containing protein [Corallococcus llansteffanensis]
MQLLRRGAVLGLGFFALGGCGGTDAVIHDPDVASVEQGLNVASNGSFETNSIGNSNLVVLEAGSTALPPWIIGGAGIKVMKSPYTTPVHGLQTIDLNGEDGAGSIVQYVPTVVGTFYSLSFSFSHGPGCVGLSRSINVLYDTSTASASSMGSSWNSRTYSFKATTTATLIKLTSTSSGGGCVAAIDNLTVYGP